ncbi:hypothetical protein L484_027467 [Morus notabilis]|uniref:Uncharacterized protein n=1 Tax=Morus notabilis TaxID=981085 RepID=W9S654_9ROSA|nr:hypothetical protein L484_027467 [Morus notabilis]
MAAILEYVMLMTSIFHDRALPLPFLSIELSCCNGSFLNDDMFLLHTLGYRLDKGIAEDEKEESNGI